MQGKWVEGAKGIDANGKTEGRAGRRRQSWEGGRERGRERGEGEMGEERQGRERLKGGWVGKDELGTERVERERREGGWEKTVRREGDRGRGERGRRGSMLMGRLEGGLVGEDSWYREDRE